MGKPRRPVEKKVLLSSDEEEAFSAEETENDSTSSDDDNAGSRKKRSRNKNSSDSSDCEDEFFGKGKKPKKKKSKKSRDGSDLDDPVMKKGSKRKLYKKEITLMTEQEIKDKYRYKKHKCALSDLPTKTKKPIGKSCRPGHPEDLKVESVKLHYVVHYKEFGYWDHIVPEEGDRAGKIDCYECQVCDKKFKNALEKQGPGSSAGRGSSICHVATDHGRLLEALLNEEKDMTSEIEFLAEHDKGFNDAYNEYFSNKKQLFGLPDDQIITSRESLVWKIYAKKPKEDDKKNESSTPKKSPMKINQTSNIPLQRNETQKPLPIELGKLEKLECPFKDEFKCNLTNKQRTEHHDFRMHFFLHYRIFKIEDVDHWDERLKNLEKGDQLSMYCDLCPIRKRIKAATENGLRNSMICHLAVIHDELRDVMEKDSRISKDFIKAVYYDIDLKKLQASGGKIPSPQKSPPKVQQSENFAKNSPPKKAETNGYKPGPKSKTKKPKESLEEENSDNVDDPEDFDFPSDESDQDSAPKRKINNVTNGSASKKSATKSKPRSRKSSPTPMRENKNIIRKRKPINFTVDDLNDDEAEDENWKGSPKVQPKMGVEGKRVMPGRRSRQTPKKTYSDSESD